MSKEKQTSDAMNTNKAAGTGNTSYKVKDTSAGSIAPAGNTTSGSSQSEKRGPQGNG